ncbi:AMP-binding protein [Pseudomonas sp. PCH446]
MNASTWEKLRNCSTIHFYNMYGPTECTVDATIDLIRDLGEKPSIGRPIANVQVHVLDVRGEPAPLGVAGKSISRCRCGSWLPQSRRAERRAFHR